MWNLMLVFPIANPAFLRRAILDCMVHNDVVDTVREVEALGASAPTEHG